ncbi:hypothetical protein CPB86DRAFT_702555 [Serendipita vermifera]|nr:hypothetical protein CPB86DRAFT_702555 [Serendipita vermifera]
MGPTGAGKSTFIDYATGQEQKGAGHGLKSCTEGIVISNPVIRGGRKYTFVDTPGFDDTYKSDTEILSMIAEYMVKARNGKYNLDAILYLHRISDNRMAGSPLKNLELFASMCGKSAMPHVVLVTTMWSHVSPQVGKDRENQLKSSFWQDMIDKGCTVQRFNDSYADAWRIIDTPSDAPTASGNGSQTNVLISTEIVDRHKELKETAAGATLNKQLEKLIKDQKEANKRLRALANSQGNPNAKQELTKRVQELDGKIAQTTQKMRELKIPFARRLLRMFKGNVSTSFISLSDILNFH